MKLKHKKKWKRIEENILALQTECKISPESPTPEQPTVNKLATSSCMLPESFGF